MPSCILSHPTCKSNRKLHHGNYRRLTRYSYADLASNLLACGCYRSAYRYCQLGLKITAEHDTFTLIADKITSAVDQAMSTTPADRPKPDEWPDTGLVRRELYPWNYVEPDRFAPASLEFLNAEMQRVAPNLEVRAVELENLTLAEPGPHGTVKQLGVFANKDIAPAELVLEETSILTANNRLNDSLCDACSVDIEEASCAVECEDCETVFCSSDCQALAMAAYHPAVCDRGLDSLARDVPPAQAADSLYLLLCLRTLAMSVTQDTHPLALKEVKYIWGDYQTGLEGQQTPGTLPFSFEMSIVMPFDILTKMDIDIFRDAHKYDVWIFNTLYAKFRGTASARLSGLKGTVARGPEVSAVHPLWCLANHSCDPNVRWEWGGRMKFWARGERVTWDNGAEKAIMARPGLKKDEEVLSHYCDIDLPVKERREWASGALGGDCRCERCVYEAAGAVG